MFARWQRHTVCSNDRCTVFLQPKDQNTTKPKQLIYYMNTALSLSFLHHSTRCRVNRTVVLWAGVATSWCSYKAACHYYHLWNSTGWRCITWLGCLSIEMQCQAEHAECALGVSKGILLNWQLPVLSKWINILLKWILLLAVRRATYLLNSFIFGAVLKYSTIKKGCKEDKDDGIQNSTQKNSVQHTKSYMQNHFISRMF